MITLLGSMRKCMRITYKTFNKIQFPAFKINSDNFIASDNIIWIDGKVLDDRNMPGKSLGIRRLETPFKGLYPLKGAAFDEVQLIRSGSGNYIDSKGIIFFYSKTKFVSLKYLKIRKIEKQLTYSIIWVADIPFPFKVPRPPSTDYSWAGVLYIDRFPWLLYEYSTERKKKAVRKI